MASYTDFGSQVSIVAPVDPGGDTKASEAGTDTLFSVVEANLDALDEIKGAAGGNLGDIWTSWDSDYTSIPKGTIKTLNKGLKKLQKTSEVLGKIMKFLELFLTSFNSFSSLVSSMLDFVETEVNKWAKDIAGAGVYFNALFPPAFNKNMFFNNNWQKLSSGGFKGFLSRLQVSLNNTADPNRPVFSSNAKVGGVIILVDTETMDEFFKSWKQLSELFDFVNLLPFNLKPQPPTNIRGKSKLEKTEDGKNKYKILLQMDAPDVRPAGLGLYMNYRISRSIVPGGVLKVEHPIPTKLGGKDGFFAGLRYRISSFFSDKYSKPRGNWPPKLVYAYEDLDPPVIIFSNLVNGSGSFIDDKIPVDDNGDPVHKQYYYVVETGFSSEGEDWIGGPRSNEVMVPVEKSCVDSGESAVIKHEKGRLEYIKAGWGGLGKWSSIQTKFLLPFMPKLIKMLEKAMKTIRGMVKNTTDSFSDFIEGIQEKFETYSFMVDLMMSMIKQILKMSLGPQMAFLYVDPKKGGIEEFMNRVRNAKQPERGFSDSKGFTAGIVFMFGGFSYDPSGNDNKEVINAETEATVKSFKFLMKFLTGKS